MRCAKVCQLFLKGSPAFSCSLLTTAECIKDRADMARFESAAGQGDVQGDPVTWDPRRDLRLCSRSRYYYRPQAVPWSACHCGLSSRLQPTPPTQISSLFVIHTRHQDTSPGVHFMSPGLLYVTCYFTVLTTGYFAACSRCRTLQHAWWQALASVTTSHQCCNDCTGCQSLSEWYSRQQDSFVSQWMESRLHTSSTTAIYCLTPADAHAGRVPATSER